VTAITEVQRMEAEVVTLQDLFAFKFGEMTNDGKIVGNLAGTGLRPASLHKFEKRGITLPLSMFNPGMGNGAAAAERQVL
jgi:pilus assembly protein CpaF